jgi:hypothetical protein
VQRGEVALRGPLVEAGVAQQPQHAVVARDVHPLDAAGIARHDLAIGVGEAAAALDAAGERAHSRVVRVRIAGEAADRRVVFGVAGEAADRRLPGVARALARHHQHGLARYARVERGHHGLQRLVMRGI